MSREPYDALVLSPGAEAVRPTLPGVNLPGIFTLRNLDDVDQIHDWIAHRRVARAVVVGGGYIGLEMVENLSRRTINVSLVELTGQVMPPMDPEMVAPVHEELRRQGVDLRLGETVTAFEPGPEDAISVMTRSGERLVARLVILAVGIRPDTRLAREAGLELGPTGGIRVDDQMRTSDPAIFAVGDAVEVRDFVTGQPALMALAGPANRQGRIAADAICGRAVALPRLAGNRGGRRLRPDAGHDRRHGKVAPPGRHRLPEIVHPFPAPCLVLPRRRADFAQIAVRARHRPRAGRAGRGPGGRGKAHRRAGAGHPERGHRLRPRRGRTLLCAAVRQRQRPREHGRLRRR